MDERPPAGAGTLGVGADGAFRIHFDRVLRHRPERVWEVLTTPAALAAWMPGSLIEPAVGGRVRFDFGEEGTATGSVLAVRPPTDDGEAGELEHTWCWDGLPTSVVIWRLEPAAEGTRLFLTHRELVREPAADFALGWHLVLDALDGSADGGSPPDPGDALASLAAHYAGLV